jgi:hypothetical protein
MQRAPITPTSCERCGKLFNTSEQHPRRYCSIACEEGRGPLPDRDPRSPNFCHFVQGNPERLVDTVAISANDDTTVGQIVAYENGRYQFERENFETGDIKTWWVDDSLVLSKIKNDDWWIDG